MTPLLNVRTRVFDAWWPHRSGVVVRRTKSSVRVRWENGNEWIYDRAHMKFLVKRGSTK